MTIEFAGVRSLFCDGAYFLMKRLAILAVVPRPPHHFQPFSLHREPKQDEPNPNLQSTSSWLQVSIPAALGHKNGYPHQEAIFGRSTEPGELTERLVYGGLHGKTHTPWTLCSSADADRLTGRSQTPFILMVDRGECTFSSQVRRAQYLGASGVLIADNSCLCREMPKGCIQRKGVPCQEEPPIVADNGASADITIPSFLMRKMGATLLKAHLQRGQTIMIEMAWSMTVPDERVEWSLWTSAVDAPSEAFKQDFEEIVKALGQRARFQPHYIVHDGTAFGCRSSKQKKRGRGRGSCGLLCSNGGRYCVPDPGFPDGSAVTGMDVVEESLRQKCVWLAHGGATGNSSDEGIGKQWWSYVNNFNSICNHSNNFHSPSCRLKALEAAGVDIDRVDRCMEISGGVINDRANVILSAELAQKRRRGVVILPTVYVNDARERDGSSVGAVLSSICARYDVSTWPDVCRCAGLPSSFLVKECMHGGPPSGGTSSSDLTFMLTVLAGVMAATWLCLRKRSQARLRREVLSEVHDRSAEASGQKSSNVVGETSVKPSQPQNADPSISLRRGIHATVQDRLEAHRAAIAGGALSGAEANDLSRSYRGILKHV